MAEILRTKEEIVQMIYDRISDSDKLREQLDDEMDVKNIYKPYDAYVFIHCGFDTRKKMTFKKEELSCFMGMMKCEDVKWHFQKLLIDIHNDL